MLKALQNRDKAPRVQAVNRPKDTTNRLSEVVSIPARGRTTAAGGLLPIIFPNGLMCNPSANQASEASTCH